MLPPQRPGDQQQPNPPKRQALASMPRMPLALRASAITNVIVTNKDVEAGQSGAAATNSTAKPPPIAARRPAWLPPGVSEYSQRRVLSATPTVAEDPLLSLGHPRYGLPPAVVANMAAMGIRSIYPWQKQCLLGGNGALLDGTRSLVYAAPTGGGKSLVADVLMLRRVLEGLPTSTASGRNGYGGGGRPKALLVLPFVALVQEKVRWLRRAVQGLTVQGLTVQGVADGPGASRPGIHHLNQQESLRVVGFFGGAKIRATWADFDIGVATIEKANALVNAAIDDCTIGDLRVVVLDELHMIDDGHRGYLLELLATKLLCLEHHVQIVGMSATLPNIDLLSTWLGAYSYQTRYRPIPIEEHLVYDGCIYSAEAAGAHSLGLLQGGARTSTSQEIKDATAVARPLMPLRSIQPSLHKELLDAVTNAVVALATETARAGFGALVFASSRAAAESDALLISRAMPVPATDVGDARADLLGELQSLSTGLDATLSQTVMAGVGFHHAGMTTEERDLIANAYDEGVLKVCVATCGLAAGINLPARRVILHNARMGRDLVGPAMLRQMRGRAGRKGKDELGETYLCCRGSDVDDVLDLMHAELPQVSSCLVADADRRRLQRALLEVIAVRLATSRDTLDEYVRKTILHHAAQQEGRDISGDVESSLAALQTMGFVEVDGRYGHFEPTRLGKAVVASALDPDDAVFVHGELERALQAFVLDGEMHVLYTFTPVHDTGGTGAINWRRFWEEMEGLDESGLRVLRLLGLKPDVIGRMMRGGTLKETTAGERATARIYRRFYLALQLRDLCNEMPVHRVAQKYDTPRGAVQNLAQTCEGFAAGMIKFCQHMGWG